MTQAFPPPSGHQPPSASELQAIAAILYEYAGIVINHQDAVNRRAKLLHGLQQHLAGHGFDQVAANSGGQLAGAVKFDRDG